MAGISLGYGSPKTDIDHTKPSCFMGILPNSKVLSPEIRLYEKAAIKNLTPLKINMEHNHGGLEDHVPF